LFGILNFSHCDLFVICYLSFGYCDLIVFCFFDIKTQNFRYKGILRILVGCYAQKN
jgi:hypothetical protein